MSMTELVKIIEDQGKGVRAYVECARICRDRLKTQSDLAAGYFLLTIAADKFVDAYDDQPLLSQRAEDEFLHFKNYVEQLDKAQTSDDPTVKLEALNRVATEITNHKLLRSSV